MCWTNVIKVIAPATFTCNVSYLQRLIPTTSSGPYIYTHPYSLPHRSPISSHLLFSRPPPHAAISLSVLRFYFLFLLLFLFLYKRGDPHDLLPPPNPIRSWRMADPGESWLSKIETQLALGGNSPTSPQVPTDEHGDLGGGNKDPNVEQGDLENENEWNSTHAKGRPSLEKMEQDIAPLRSEVDHQKQLSPMSPSQPRPPLREINGLDIYKAIHDGNYRIVEELLMSGEDPNSAHRASFLAKAADHRLGSRFEPPEVSDMSPLTCAVLWNQSEIAQLLLEHGANPDSGSKTPLYTAVQAHIHYEQLYRGQADSGSKQFIERIPADSAKLKMVQLLIKHSKDPFQRDSKVNNPFLTTLRSAEYPAIDAFLNNGTLILELHQNVALNLLQLRNQKTQRPLPWFQNDYALNYEFVEFYPRPKSNHDRYVIA